MNKRVLPAALSRSQIDKLGDRFRDGTAGDADYMLLALYRDSFEPAYRFVVETLQSEVRLQVTGRRGKTTPSIVAKLRRIRTRLSQMQDIAGCRLVVKDYLAQERVFAWLMGAFPGAVVDDRRINPSHGYRAIHIIPNVDGKAVEIQLRTKLQHLWAEFSESIAFQFYEGLKYGEAMPTVVDLIGESPLVRQAILSTPDAAERERLEETLADPIERARLFDSLPDETKSRLENIRKQLDRLRAGLMNGSDEIRTIETSPPGKAASRLRRRTELQFQELISILETRDE